MTLGRKLKSLRTEHELSQPELADKIGIEQSYLSKLENDKSLPSNEVLRKILDAFNLSLSTFLKDFELGKEHGVLRQIPIVDEYFSEQETVKFAQQRVYFITSSFIIVLAVTLFYMGYSKQVFSETQFQYESQGVIFEGEPDIIFSRWMSLLSPDESADRTFMANKKLEIALRVDEKMISLFKYAGQSFKQKQEDGHRHFVLKREKQIKRPINAWLQVLGVFLFSLGIMGFVIERRFFK
ncbi:helix-turn-helix transcriptional regulator [uncultured Paraglaciecola sp.]|uniref:helix-turn-helix domain-containing protein n=1 Tax=uncultured Paraglaciecola sp. TaxID=1765024 RepID=UPI0025960B3F|nr:helix-turn-helix transcriptional regulator [uncultured Paraglaciecola sp.]